MLRGRCHAPLEYGLWLTAPSVLRCMFYFYKLVTLLCK